MTGGPRGVGAVVVRVLLVCGSLQRRSANRAALDVVRAIAIEHGATVEEFDALADIPAFDFTRQDEPIAAVTEWRRRVAEADVIVMAAPEYAGGLAGVAKNALDWLVGSGDLYRKPVAVVTAGTSGGLHARRQLVQTLTWQGAYVVAELGIAVPRTKSNQRGQIIDHVWDYDFDGEFTVVETFVSSLRRKVDPQGDAIQTVRGFGYRLHTP